MKCHGVLRISTTSPMRYKAVDAGGHIIHGTSRLSQEALQQSLAHEDKMLIYAQTERQWWQRSITRQDRLLAFEQLYHLTTIGIDIMRSIQIVAESVASGPLKDKLENISSHLRAGQNFGDSLSYHRDLLPYDCHTILNLGEKTGKLPETLKIVRESLQWQHTFQTQLKQQLAYPLLACAAIAVMMVVLCQFVIPQLGEWIIASGTPLTLSTKILIILAPFVPWIIGTLFVSAFIMWILSRSHKISLHTPLAWTLIRTPFLRTLFNDYRWSWFTHRLAIALESGLTLSAGIQHLQHSSLWPDEKAMLGRVFLQLQHGATLHQSLAYLGMCPESLIAMFRSAEAHHQLAKTSFAARDFLRQSFESQCGVFIKRLEPMLIIFMGLWIMWIVAGFFLPLYETVSLGTSI